MREQTFLRRLRTTVGVLTRLAAGALVAGCGKSQERDALAGSSAIPIGVLGDSDSHSYGDRILIPGAEQRGGAYRESTLQWTEVWAKLRPDEVSMGRWGEWGTRGAFATVLRAVGLPGRAPPKEDFRFNFALSGAICAHLDDGMSRQVSPLLGLMKGDPEWWADGIVIIRIGVNSFGQPEHLDQYASGERVPALEDCVARITRTVVRIRTDHPLTRIVLVGIFNNVHWAAVTDRWHDPVALARISDALAPFDSALVALANADPRITFHDDQAWMNTNWGGRAADGTPDYRARVLENGMEITNTRGDHPSNVVVEDGHLGTVANALWLRSVVETIVRDFGLEMTPITDDEIAALVAARW